MFHYDDNGNSPLRERALTDPANSIHSHLLATTGNVVEALLVKSCLHPLTASRVVKRIYTEYGVFEPNGYSFNVVGLADGISASDLVERRVPLLTK